MIIEQEQNEFAQNFAGQIALECEKLETALHTGLEEFDNSAKLLGKSWYSLGLESDEADQTKDSANKRNILLRIIDSVVNFIKMIGQKIVAWFKACKAAIMKFFGGDKIDPKAVADRSHILAAGLSKENIDDLVGSLSQESKALLAEALDPDYARAFSDLYVQYAKLTGPCHTLDGVISHREDFAQLKVKSDELKALAKSGKIAENADEVVRNFLATGGDSKQIAVISDRFSHADDVHTILTNYCEGHLKKIPASDLEKMEGDDVDHKRRELVQLISDVLKIDGEIVARINHHMQAVAMFYNAISLYRSKKLVFIRM